MFVGLFVNLGGTTVPGGTDMIQTSGYSQVGKGAALYVRDGTSTWSAAATAKRNAAIAAGILSGTVDASLAARCWRLDLPEPAGRYVYAREQRQDHGLQCHGEDS